LMISVAENRKIQDNINLRIGLILNVAQN